MLNINIIKSPIFLHLPLTMSSSQQLSDKFRFYYWIQACLLNHVQVFWWQRSYLVKGGFRSWVNEGLRIKELKPETTLTILNEVVPLPWNISFLIFWKVNSLCFASDWGWILMEIHMKYNSMCIAHSPLMTLFDWKFEHVCP